VLKNSWATRAAEFLRAVAARTTVGALRTKLEAVGIALWAARVLRRAIADIHALIEWIRAPDDLSVQPATAAALRTVVLWVVTPRRLLHLSTFITVTVAAVDATPSCIAACVYPPQPIDPQRLRDDIAPSTDNPLLAFVGSVFDVMRQCDQVFAYSHDIDGPRRTINGTELVAILLAVILAPERCLLLILTDSVVAKAWTRRGLAPTTWASHIVSLIVAAADYKQCRLFLVHVETALNPADKYSRDRRLIGLDTDIGLRNVPYLIDVMQVTSWV
jgi:hypothetical protein